MTDPTVTEALARTSMRRAVSIMAPASLFVGLPGAWSIVTTRGAAAPIVIVALACVAIVIAGAAIAAARNERQVERLDVAVLALAVIVQVAQFAVTWTGRRYWTDEARLNHDALRTLMSGHDPYPVSYPGVAAHGTGTPLLGGGSITHYSYPPFSLELGRALGSISDRLATPAVVGEIALLATVVATFLVLPRAWRSVAVTLTLGLDILPPLAHGGYAILLVLALMCGVLYRWTETGSEGRLGRLGLFRAICLGAAAASQQFAWFVALFVVLGILLVRRGELGTRKAALVVGRYVLVALTTFVILNAPFVIASPRAWLTGITSVLTQHAMIWGQGPAVLSVVVFHGSGALDDYGRATLLLLVGLLVIYAAGFRRLAPAVAVLPSLVFALSERSPLTYFAVFIPLWVVGLAGCRAEAVQRARPVRIPGFNRSAAPSRWRGPTGVVLALLPAVACFAVAIATPEPLSMRLSTMAMRNRWLTGLSVLVRNDSSDQILPSFFVDPRTGIHNQWRIVSGPHRLGPKRTATYSLSPEEAVPAAEDLWIFATSQSPSTISAIPLRPVAAQITHNGTPAGPIARRGARRCALMLARHSPRCPPL